MSTHHDDPPPRITRRGLIRSGVASATLVSSLGFTRMAHAQAGVIKIGFVSPKTGPLAGFAESDDYIIAGINAVFGEGLTMRDLLDAPHGLDLGPLVRRLPERLQNRAKRIDLAPDLYLPELDRLTQRRSASVGGNSAARIAG